MFILPACFILLLPLFHCQEWTEPVKLHESIAPIVFQKHWVDQEDLSKHFIYAEYESRKLITLLYRKLFANGTITSPMPILRGHCHHESSGISGANDGKRVYIVANVKRTPESEYFDVFFLESKDGGLSWTDPIPIPREDTNDDKNRYYPNVRFNENKGRLWVFYFVADGPQEEGVISYSTRPRGSSVFINEVEVLKKEKVRSPLQFYITEGKMNGLHLAFKDEEGYIQYRMSKDSLDWIVDYCRITNTDHVDLAVHESLPGVLYTFEGYVEKNGIIPRYSDNYARNCQSPYYWPAPFAANYYSNKFCKTDKGLVLLAYAARTRDSVGNTKAFLFAKNLTDTKNGMLAERPFQTVPSTYIDTPYLECRYDPFDKGTVSVSSIVYTQDGQKYAIYLSEAKLTPDWTLSGKEMEMNLIYQP
eukprot:TRINITY_DN135890_c0_g1_i1.p1 TRINITY_DN135890_c0_g1~~TRINITY_DN135890_c0_g1_i1.p1  ORF type:complete len:419 (-),score=11.29 TRINITY_DN135890_c0_g1_i1:159-1415(-)